MARNVIQKSLAVSREEATRLASRLDVQCQAEIAALTAEDGAVVRAMVDPLQPGARAPSAGRPVCLRGYMNRPLGNGPTNGMYALQRAVLEAQHRGELPWLRIDCNMPRDDELAWYWNFQDVPELLRWDAAKRPYVCGPCVLFQSSFQPGAGHGEREICRSANCRAFFTESAWYADLIRAQIGGPGVRPVITWPFPIWPQPEEPAEAKYDLLIFQKSGPRGLGIELAQRFKNSITIQYGSYLREQLFEVARRSRCCAYLSSDDRGPLALAEILLAGCPAAGIERGAPWCAIPGLGIVVDRLDAGSLAPALVRLMGFHRGTVRSAAMQVWDPQRIVGVITAALEEARRG